jgi:uncharacterized membrane protein YqjE
MKRIISLFLIAFSIMHISAAVIFLIRYQTLKAPSILLGVVFFVLGIYLYRHEKSV